MGSCAAMIEGDEVSLLSDFPKFSVNEKLKSRIVDVFGKPIDGKAEIDVASSDSIGTPMLNVRAPPIVHRERLTPRLIHTGNKVMLPFLPIIRLIVMTFSISILRHFASSNVISRNFVCFALLYLDVGLLASYGARSQSRVRGR